MKKLLTLLVLTLFFWVSFAFDFTNWVGVHIRDKTFYSGNYPFFWDKLSVCIDVEPAYIKTHLNKKAVLYIKWYWIVWTSSGLDYKKITTGSSTNNVLYLVDTSSICWNLKQWNIYKFMSNAKSWFVDKNLHLGATVEFYLLLIK